MVAVSSCCEALGNTRNERNPKFIIIKFKAWKIAAEAMVFLLFLSKEYALKKKKKRQP
jgi:hypothetical protein